MSILRTIAANKGKTFAVSCLAAATLVLALRDGGCNLTVDRLTIHARTNSLERTNFPPLPQP